MTLWWLLEEDQFFILDFLFVLFCRKQNKHKADDDELR